MPDIQGSQGATLSFNGQQLGTYIGMSPRWSVGSVHETTNKNSPVLGSGADSRVLKQFAVSTMEPGTVEVRFLGNPTLNINQIGNAGTLSIVWEGGQYSGKGFATELSGEITAGDLIRWSMTFHFSGYY
jgi:hypothetical protein